MVRLSRALTATALALAGCSGSGSSGEFTAVDPTGASDTARDTDREDTDGEEKYEVDNDGNEGETEVDPSQFEAYGGYIVAAWDAGLRGCMISLDEGDIESFQCAVDFSGYPIAPHQSDKVATEDGYASALQYDPVYGFYPVSDRLAGSWNKGDVRT